MSERQHDGPFEVYGDRFKGIPVNLFTPASISCRSAEIEELDLKKVVLLHVKYKEAKGGQVSQECT